jgi:L-ascorbate 6-phosphate lactonase
MQNEEAGLWFLGQAGYIARSREVSLAIDPYLSDSVGATDPDFTRQIPVPIEPGDLDVDIFIVTHDHLDHLDPDTVRGYRHVDSTVFVAPRLAAGKLVELGVPKESIVRIDSGEAQSIKGVCITGVFALPTGKEVIDTTGYLVEFENGRSFYHASDTAYCELLLKAAPHAEVLLVPINGKWGNLNIEQAALLVEAVKPRTVIPNHYDVMALNSENPEAFRHRCKGADCVILPVMQPFIWS